MSADLTVPPLPGPEVWHDLKCWPDYFAESIAGRKPFEIRKNDRGFKVGDGLVLREFNFDTGAYSGRECRARITSIIDYPPGLKDGYVVLGLAALLRAVPPLPVVAWLNANDGEPDRVVPEQTMAGARKDGGAILSSLRGYSDPLVRKADADAAIASLQARLEAAERDAARYRWLRDMDMLDQPSVDLASAFRKYTGSALDSAIDRIAAIYAATSQEGK
jgi:hypothetical protein